ncbi:MAG TPA: nuclear transport factor 2 family protein [Verrucomicrobiae bacterium]|nr:nuclear transport factor 2 family protein [Verrucomicrobiae bacterium]
MKLTPSIAIGALCIGALAGAAIKFAIAPNDQETLLQSDLVAFKSGTTAGTLDGKFLDPNFTWTDSSGNTQNKSEILEDFRSGKGLPMEGGKESSGGNIIVSAISAHADGQVGLVQTTSGKLYILRVWVKRRAGWQLLIYQAVSIGAPPSAEPGNGGCENPCNTVPFQPQNEDEREVIQAYQAVERAVAAHDSAAWAAHIADEFFAVTSNSDRPLDKATRMKGLDNQKVAGIAPFPLVSARMFEFGGAMVMTSLQQPEHGLPLHVTRVWFKRNGTWLEAYSYQTTIQAAGSTR